jgi:hypothetical protein
MPRKARTTAPPPIQLKPTTDMPTNVDPSQIMAQSQTVSRDTMERAWKAAERFRRMTPSLTVFARALTRNPKIRVVMSPEVQGAATDGENIYMSPPIELADDTPHTRGMCETRDNGGRLMCESCARREAILVVIYHEVAHIVADSFAKVDDDDLANIITQAIATEGSKYGKYIQTELAKRPTYMPTGYAELCLIVSPYMKFLVNCLEDVRVNREMWKARPGTQQMFEAWANDIFDHGIETDHGVVSWRDQPENAQVMIGLFAKGSGYNIDGWFTDQVAWALADPELNDLLWKLNMVRGIRGVYKLAFPLLARLRQLGFCRSDADDDVDPEDQETPPEPQPEDESDDKSEEPDADGSGEDSAGEDGDADPDGDDDSGSPDDAGDGDADDADADASESDEAGTGDAGEDADAGTGSDSDGDEVGAGDGDVGDGDSDDDGTDGSDDAGDAGDRGDDAGSGSAAGDSESSDPDAGGAPDESSDAVGDDEPSDPEGSGSDGGSDSGSEDSGSEDVADGSDGQRGRSDGEGDAADASGADFDDPTAGGAGGEHKSVDARNQQRDEAHTDDIGESDHAESDYETTGDIAADVEGDDPQGDEPIESGADGGHGDGVDARNMGTPEQAGELLARFGGHNPKTGEVDHEAALVDRTDDDGDDSSADPFSDGSAEVSADQAAINQAIVQGQYFEKP